MADKKEEIEYEPKKDADYEKGYGFYNQISALLSKSATLQKRQYRTNCCQILFPLLLLLLLFLIQLLVTNIVRDQFGSTAPANPNPALFRPFFLFFDENADSCKAFEASAPQTGRVIISGDPDRRIQNRLQFTNSQFRNPQGLLAFKIRKFFEQGGRPPSICYASPQLLNPVTVVESTTRGNLNDAVFNAWGNTSFQIHGGASFDGSDFVNRKYRLNFFTNQSMNDGNDFGAVLNLFANGIYRSLSPNNESELTLSGTQNYPTGETDIDFDLISLIGPSFYMYIFQLILPVFLGNLVQEKEQKLREIMIMMGLKSHVYWLVTYFFNLFLYVISTALMILFAVILDFRFFTENSFGVYFIFFFIWGNVLIALSFLLATFFTKSRTATVIGYLYVFGSGLLASQLIESYYENRDTPAGTMFILQAIPPFAFYRGLYILRTGVAFDSTGLTMSDLSDSEVGMGEVFGYLVVEWIIALLLAMYLEAVLPSSIGVKRDPLFCLRRSFWSRNKDALEMLPDLPEPEDEPVDIKEQRKRARENKDAALRVINLRKEYPSVGGNPPHVAVKNLSMAIPFGGCYGFLGPNGAGKSTTINMICGYTMPSQGAIKILGFNALQNMDAIHMVMGVCPQDNVLWGDLTGREHMAFYGRMKGLLGKDLDDAIEVGLKNVQLWDVRDKRAGSYSGGMKRRLCVANSLIGNPKIVLLDEPTTGLDPVAKRSLWSVINAYKKQCCMLLTTHSMEEAEFLCDTLGIFDQGELKCIGTSSQLKQRFQKAYKLTLTTPPSHEQEMRTFALGLAPGVMLLNSLGGTSNFEVPIESSRISDIFKAIEKNKARLGITDWGLSNTTLEEIFVRIASGIYDTKALKRRYSSQRIEVKSADAPVQQTPPAEIKSAADVSLPIDAQPAAAPSDLAQPIASDEPPRPAPAQPAPADPVQPAASDEPPQPDLPNVPRADE